MEDKPPLQDCKDFDDSGCVQDGDSSLKPDAEMETDFEALRPSLLDLSDDVLLCILQHLAPRELKALGYTCARLGTLVLDHTLWCNVNAGEERCGVSRLRWMVEHALNPGTRTLAVQGLAREAKGCLGYINRTKPLKKEKKPEDVNTEASFITDPTRKRTQDDASQGNEPVSTTSNAAPPPYPVRQPAHLHIWASSARQLPRFTASPYWPKEAEESESRARVSSGCCGPIFTVTPSILAAITATCQITDLKLEFANINAALTGLSKFPKTLKSLSLRGTKCFNMAMDTSFLYRINEFLPELEDVDVSECDWMEPAALIPLSKLPCLLKLVAQNCNKLFEFLAYGSLAARYGFKTLKVLDVRGSPLGESEVSPFSYVATLEELYMSSGAMPFLETPEKHAHYRDELLPHFTELDDWEVMEPDYYKIKRDDTPSPEPQMVSTSIIEDFSTETQIRPSNIFTVTLSRNSSPVVEQVAPENLHQFFVSTDMLNEFRSQRTPEPKPKKPRTDDGESSQASQEDGAKQDEGNKDKDNKDGGTNSDSDEEDVVPVKKPRIDDSAPSTSNPTLRVQKFVKFRRNLPPIIVTKDNIALNYQGSVGEEGNNNSNPSTSRNQVGNASGPSTSRTPAQSDPNLRRLLNNAGVGSNLDMTDELIKRSIDNLFGSTNMFHTDETPDQLNLNLPDPDVQENANNEIADDENRNQANDDGVANNNVPQDANENNNVPMECEANAEAEKFMRDDDDDDDDEDDDDDDDVKRNKNVPKNYYSDKPGNSSSDPRFKANVVDKYADGVEGSSKEKVPENDKAKTIQENGDAAPNNGDGGQENINPAQRHADGTPAIANAVPENNNALQDNANAVPENANPVPANANPVPGNANDVPANANAVPGNNDGQEHDINADYNLRVDNIRPQNVGPNPPPRIRMSYLSNLFYSPATRPLDSTTLITDACIRMFGRSDNEDVNYVHIGPNGAFFVGRGRENGIRPHKSNLRRLVCTNYSRITNSSLDHLATAAPRLEFVDFSGTKVTQQGVDEFKSLRPDCEVVFSPFVQKL